MNYPKYEIGQFYIHRSSSGDIAYVYQAETSNCLLLVGVVHYRTLNKNHLLIKDRFTHSIYPEYVFFHLKFEFDPEIRSCSLYEPKIKNEDAIFLILEALRECELIIMENKKSSMNLTDFKFKIKNISKLIKLVTDYLQSIQD